MIRAAVAALVLLATLSGTAQAQHRHRRRHAPRVWYFRPVVIEARRPAPQCEVIGPRLDGQFVEICDGHCRPIVTVEVAQKAVLR